MARNHRLIDAELACVLMMRLQKWPLVASEIATLTGHTFHPLAIYRACHARGLIDRYGLRKLARKGTGNAKPWKPPRPRSLAVIPNYATNTTRPANAA